MVPVVVEQAIGAREEETPITPTVITALVRPRVDIAAEAVQVTARVAGVDVETEGEQEVVAVIGAVIGVEEAVEVDEVGSQPTLKAIGAAAATMVVLHPPHPLLATLSQLALILITRP